MYSPPACRISNGGQLNVSQGNIFTVNKFALIELVFDRCDNALARKGGQDERRKGIHHDPAR